MFQDIRVEAGQTTGAIEDVPGFQEHQFILQARRFIQGGSNPVMYYAAVRKSLPQVGGVEHKTAMRLLDSIETALINTAADDLKKANDARAAGDTKATKPADLYRKYHKDLLAIMKRGTVQLPYQQPFWTTTAMQAKEVDTNLFLDQSLSTGDLENPDFVDPYTGEQTYETLADFEKAIPDQHTPGLEELLKFINMAPDLEAETTSTALSDSHKELLQQAARCRIDLGWGDKEVEAFLKANMEGVDLESDDIPQPFDDIDPYTPPTLLPNELVLNKELWWSARDAVVSFNRARSDVFAKMKKSGVKSKVWHSTFRKLITDTWQFPQLIDAIARVAKEDIVTGAALYLSVAGEYGVTEDDVADIRGMQTNAAAGEAFLSLVNFAAEWEDDLLNLTQDALSPTSETPTAYIHEYAQHTLSDIAATMPKYDPNPVNTASWNKAFIEAVANGAEWKEAENSAWAAWREDMSPRAAEAYNYALKQTGDRKKAMAAFWAVAPREVPRPKDQIAVIKADKSGLKLTNGRQISWNIAKVKIEKDELFLTPDIKKRLLAALQQNKCGQQIWSLLK